MKDIEHNATDHYYSFCLGLRQALQFEIPKGKLSEFEVIAAKQKLPQSGPSDKSRLNQ